MSLMQSPLDISTLLNNKLMFGGILVMMAGTIASLFKKLPTKLWEIISKQFTVTVEIMNNSDGFLWIANWLYKHPYNNKARRLSLFSSYIKKVLTPILTPAPGYHYIWHNNRLLIIHRERKDGDKREALGENNNPKEIYHITAFGRSQKYIRSLIEEAKNQYIKDNIEDAKLFSNNSYGWEYAKLLPNRPLDSIFLPNNSVNIIKNDVIWFLENEELYKKWGIPYRRRYLFHGVPGSGKTSLISALASELNLNVYILSLSNTNLTDSSLRELFEGVHPKSIILIEDIDGYFMKRELENIPSDKKSSTTKPEKKEFSRITLSGMLNTMDGLSSTDGSLLFMTTNSILSLDEAMIRPGRVDIKLQFDYAVPEQIEKVFLKFYPDINSASIFSNKLKNINVSVADVQTYLLKYRTNINDALNNISELIRPDKYNLKKKTNEKRIIKKTFK